MIVTQIVEADKEAMVAAAKGGREVGRVVMLDVIRKLSDEMVDGSFDSRAILLEQMLRRLERPLPRPDLADPLDWEGYKK